MKLIKLKTSKHKYIEARINFFNPCQITTPLLQQNSKLYSATRKLLENCPQVQFIQR